LVKLAPSHKGAKKNKINRVYLVAAFWRLRAIQIINPATKYLWYSLLAICGVSGHSRPLLTNPLQV